MIGVYGPHDPASAPTTVLVLTAGFHGWPEEQAIPLPAGLVEQRRQINTLAHGGAP